MKRLVILLSVLLIAVTGPAFAQSTTGTIDVIVTDSSGAPLPGVTVTATASDTNTRRTEVTGADGKASLVSLQPSTFHLTSRNCFGITAPITLHPSFPTSWRFLFPLRRDLFGCSCSEIQRRSCTSRD